MKKILIVGASGLIGHQIYQRLHACDDYEVLHIAHQRRLNHQTILLDARDEYRFEACVRDLKPNVIVNAMGILIAEANANPEHAIFLNAYMPHHLRMIADSMAAKLIHISTDCVFSGKKGAYVESDMKDADDIYGRAKGLGEVTTAPHLTLRTSVVGPELKEGEELFHWFMSQSGKIKGFTRALWSGVSTIELAKAVEWAIRENVQGLYHITNGKPISKYDLLMLFKKHTHKVIDIESVEGRVTDKSFVDTRHALPYDIPDYDDMVRDMVIFIRERSELYPHYRLG